MNDHDTSGVGFPRAMQDACNDCPSSQTSGTLSRRETDDASAMQNIAVGSYLNWAADTKLLAVPVTIVTRKKNSVTRRVSRVQSALRFYSQVSK